MLSFAALSGKIVFMRTIWRPQLSSYFQEATHDVYFYRTANMSSSIATRVEGFEELLKGRTNEVAHMLRNLYAVDNYVVQHWEPCQETDCSI